jgi:hypothetical protein
MENPYCREPGLISVYGLPRQQHRNRLHAGLARKARISPVNFLYRILPRRLALPMESAWIVSRLVCDNEGSDAYLAVAAD